MANTNDMNAPTKVPCGGFVLGEGLALGEDGKTLNVTGGGSQADWNQNDETAVDYVKNRPGGYDATELVTITDETVVSGQMFSNYLEVFNFFEKHTREMVIVTFDGTPYQCVISDTVPFYVGDRNFVEYPFYIYTNFSIESLKSTAYFETATAGESHTVKIEHRQATPVVFDRKYLPDTQILTESLPDYAQAKGTYKIFMVNNSDGVPKWNMPNVVGIVPCVMFYRRDSGAYNIFGIWNYEIVNDYLSHHLEIFAACWIMTDSEYKIYIGCNIKDYRSSSNVKGVEFKFISLSDQSTLTLFYKEDGSVVEGNPNITE